ncbi:hypothetical protein ABI59_09225 [Acidobacteria bacterium Mor1]|nr:hypothetical protein ABI59_09225 [Acidobacteria bacterium Mor1]
MGERPARPHTAGHLRFGVFEVSPDTGELTKRGARVHLPEKPFQVLAALLERPGELVTRDELRLRLWGDDTFVDFDNNLNAAVRKLRESLGDSADSPRFVETLPRRGYRFIAPVEPVPSAASAPSAAALGAVDAKDNRVSAGGRVRRWTPWIALLPLLLLAAWWLADARRNAPQSAGAATGRVMLAVLPFVDLDDGQEKRFFADGMTEELIMQLGRLQPERLGVIARMSAMHYRDSSEPVDVIGKELGVDYVIEGSVRASADRLRVTAQLIQVSDQTHLWSDAYDVPLDDVLQVQGEVAVRVAQALALELLPDEPLAQARAGTRNTRAYEAYLRGRYEWNTFQSERYPQAVAHFEQAIALDPDYAAAWAGLANVHNLRTWGSALGPMETFPAARRAAERALELDPSSPEAHAALGFVRLYGDFDATGADREFRRAVELAPNYAMAYHWWAGALAALERHDEAIGAVRRAAELDPVSLSVLSDLGWYYLFADRYEEGLAECRGILEGQGYGWAEACMYHGLVALGREREALAYTAYAQPEVAREFEGRKAGEILAALRQRRLRELRDGERRPAGELELAMAAAEAGEKELAFDAVERAWDYRDPWLMFLQVDPRLDGLSGDPRRNEISRRLGLPSR